MIFLFFLPLLCHGDEEALLYRNKARDMFLHGYRNYMKHAFPHDELQPISCQGRSDWGNISMTLIDSLDTLVVMGMYSEFELAVNRVLEHARFDMDKNVSVFETNIRVVGGLLSAHLLMDKAKVALPEGWPCSGPLLELAAEVASKLLPAFATATGLPYGTVNLLYGVPRGETTVTGTASCGTFLLEFGLLSRLTGDPLYEHAARRALAALYTARSKINLVGNHIDVARAEWVYREAGIGGNVDSYYEYLLKAGIYFEDSQLIGQFRVLYGAVVKYLQHDHWYIWANMFTGLPSLPSVSTLDAFWPSLQVLTGDIKSAAKTLSNFYSLISHYGFTPELFSLLKGQVNAGNEIYPLRPEFVESLWYIHRATGDNMWRNMGKQVMDAIEISTRTTCGYATVQNVVTHQLEDRMESFFLSETTKYLYLLFSDDHWATNDINEGDVALNISEDGSVSMCGVNKFGYIFTTEAHPLPLGVLGCCHPYQKIEDTKILQRMYNNASLDSTKIFTKYTEEPLPSTYYTSLQHTPLPSTSSYLTHLLTTTLRSHLPITYPDSYHPNSNPSKPAKSKHLYDFTEILPILSVPESDSLDYKEGFYTNTTCNTRSWYERYEVYGAEFVKVSMKKAFRVVKNSH